MTTRIFRIAEEVLRDRRFNVRDALEARGFDLLRPATREYDYAAREYVLTQEAGDGEG